MVLSKRWYDTLIKSLKITSVNCHPIILSAKQLYRLLDPTYPDNSHTSRLTLLIFMQDVILLEMGNPFLVLNEVIS